MKCSVQKPPVDAIIGPSRELPEQEHDEENATHG